MKRNARPLLLLAIAALVALGSLVVAEPPACGQMTSFSYMKERDAGGLCFNGNNPDCGNPLN